MTRTRSEEVARFAVELREANVPVGVRAKAERHILDTLACGLAGACSAEGAGLLDVVLDTEPPGAAPVWGTDRAVAARSAALVNGTACHAFELDDTGGCDHSGAVVLPAAIAALGLSDRPVSGSELLISVILGYDVARRVLEACGAYRPHNEAGWHSTATCGTFGAAIAAARILRLDAERTASALGHAASFSGGLWAFIHDGAQTKRVHAGRAAEGGLLAALMARNGLKGPAQVFEDVWGGFLRTFAPGSAVPDALLEGLGASWRLERVAIKPYASCRGTHAAIDATLHLFERHDLTADRVRAVRVRAPAFLDGMCGGREVSSLPGAQMSLPFALASAMAHGHVDLAAFGEKERGDARLRSLMAKVELTVDPALGGSDEPFIELDTVDGQSFAHRVTDPLGSPTNPVGEAQHEAKVRRLAGMVLAEEAVDRLVLAIEILQRTPDIRNLPELLVGAGRPAPFA